MEIRCRFPLPSPQAAGYDTKEGLIEAARTYPHLRPCYKNKWEWIVRKKCERCRYRVEVELEGRKESGKAYTAPGNS